MKRTCVILLLITLCLSVLTSCGASEGGDPSDQPLIPAEKEWNKPLPPAEDENDRQDTPDGTNLVENRFVSVAETPVSTFSADVDTASYTYFRKLVGNGYTVNQLRSAGIASALRTEEFVNYFRYTANAPQDGELFGVTAAMAPAPWNTDNMLLRLTLEAAPAAPAAGNNLVFLIDVSGSMRAQDKLPLLQDTFALLTDQLTAADRVSVVTYSGEEKIVLAGTPGNQKETILAAIRALTADGSTNGEAGLRMAYSLAEDWFIEGGNNRIIMASDGDLNVGISDPQQLKSFVEGKRDRGIYLSVLGFGTGNYRDASMEALADNGNGAYYYIDGASETERVFGTNLLSTLYTVADDVKLQLTFDADYVEQYRLIGYENRVLSEHDFTDDTKDAGEVGAGTQVTVLYELKPTAGSAALLAEQLRDAEGDLAAWMTLAVRYKNPGERESRLNEYPVGAGSIHAPDSDFTFMAAVAETVMILHNSPNGGRSLPEVLRVLDDLDMSGKPDRTEFRNLVYCLINRV